jgi:hypothetical protein
MGTLANISGKEAVKAFQQNGWVQRMQGWQPFDNDQAGTPGETLHPATQSFRSARFAR